MTPNNYPEGLDELAREVAKPFITNTQYLPFHQFRHYARALLDALAERGYVLVDAKKQEPVAWMHPSGSVIRSRDTGLERAKYTIPLYAHPAIPGRVALPDGWKVIGEVIGCFDAAFAEGLQEALAETQDERLKDLVERRLMHALYAAQEAAPTPPTQPQGDGSLRRDADAIRRIRSKLESAIMCHPNGVMFLVEEALDIAKAAMEASNGNA